VEKLRKHIFAFATSGKVDFDVLLDKVLARMPERSMPALEPADKAEIAAPVRVE
jgi:hypothetical protein